VTKSFPIGLTGFIKTGVPGPSLLKIHPPRTDLSHADQSAKRLLPPLRLRKRRQYFRLCTMRDKPPQVIPAAGFVAQWHHPENVLPKAAATTISKGRKTDFC
jgi:hypothetical protein